VFLDSGYLLQLAMLLLEMLLTNDKKATGRWRYKMFWKRLMWAD